MKIVINFLYLNLIWKKYMNVSLRNLSSMEATILFYFCGMETTKQSKKKLNEQAAHG